MTNPPTIIELPVFPTDRSHIGHGGVENNNIQSGAVITAEGDWGPGREGISWAEMSLIKNPRARASDFYLAVLVLRPGATIPSLAEDYPSQ